MDSPATRAGYFSFAYSAFGFLQDRDVGVGVLPQSAKKS